MTATVGHSQADHGSRPSFRCRNSSPPPENTFRHFSGTATYTTSFDAPAQPADQRTTWLSHKDHTTLTPDAPLDPSGLIGPVAIRAVQGIALEDTPKDSAPSDD